MTTKSIGFPLYSSALVDPKTGVATKEFFFFLQQLWHTGTGGAVRSVSVDDLQIQDELESAAGDTAGVVDAGAIASLENLGVLADDVPVQTVSDELLSQLAQEQDAAIDADAQALAYLHFDPEPTPRAQPVSGITVGASPYAYKTSFDGSVIVNSGTVSLIEFSRDGSAFFTLGTTAGIVPLSRGDTLRTTYTVAPTMTFIPR